MFYLNMTTDLSQRGILVSVTMIRRDEIMEVIKYRYAEKQKANLPIFGIKSQNLRGVTTTEKDMKKG